MAKRAFDKDATNKSEALREAINTVGMDAENATVREWIEDHWSGWIWGSNPAGEIGAARKSLARQRGAGRPVGKPGRRKSVVVKRRGATQLPEGEISPQAIRAAVALLNATSDPNAAIDKARRVLSIGDRDQVSAILEEMAK